MSQITIMLCVSLDGYMADAQGDVGWLLPFQNDQASDEVGLDGFIAAVDMVIMGRRTFDQVLGFGGDWPYDGKRVVVLTNRPLPDVLPRGVVASDDLKTTVEAARQRRLRVWICGGADAIAQALAQGFADEIELFIAPVVLGAGLRWITASALTDGPRVFDLLACEGFRCGLVRLHYQPR